MALLLTLVGISLSALLVPLVVNQLTATRTAAGRTGALHAAQAGIDVAVGRIRHAADGAGNGMLERLPGCELTGSLAPNTSLRPPRYRVRITYRDAGGNALNPATCAPWDRPAVATLVATGTEAPTGAFDAGTPGTRTIEATYVFSTDNDNIAGGAIPLNGTTLCLDAGPNDPPLPGARLRVQPCTPGVARQRFAYTSDLNLRLVGSESVGAPNGMCLNATGSGAQITFQPCQGRTNPQQWSLDDSSKFRGTSNGATINNLCFTVDSPVQSGSYVSVATCSSTLNNRQIFRPQPAIGAGGAGANTGQLVNFKQFSRCLDVTDFTVSRPYMIVWFCKQAPDGNVPWNQKWSFPTVPAPIGGQAPAPVTGRISTLVDNSSHSGYGNRYCLRSPGTTASTSYVRVALCSSNVAGLDWTFHGDTGYYPTSYRIVDQYGYCLTPTDLGVTNPDTHSDGTAKVKVAACDGSELQKWNANSNLSRPSPLKDLAER